MTIHGNYKPRLHLLFTGLLTLLFLTGISTTSRAQPDGEKVFKANCAACHRIDKDLIGPALHGVVKRWGGKTDLIHKWVKDPASVKAMNIPHVNELLAKWEPKSGLMPGQPVDDAQITAVLKYIQNWKPPASSGGEQASAGAASGSASSGAQQSNGSWIWMVIIALVLLIIIFSLTNVQDSLTNAVREKKGLEPLPDISYGLRIRKWLWKNIAFVSVIGVIVIAILLTWAYIGLMGIGVYQGYKPDQPIAFNHKLHAGTMQIDCKYCHNSAEKSRTAGIPTANVCMNCHKGISTGRSKKGTAEIQKIYHAVGWDPDKFAYTGKTHPIKWVKVHNLPDLVYFNHAQHVNVGKIACQKCHGEVQKDFTVGQQFAPLTMGWCIDCHNKTAVQMKGNGYYDEVHRRLVKYGAKDLKKFLEDGKITEREMGGWECAKCHY